MAVKGLTTPIYHRYIMVQWLWYNEDMETVQEIMQRLKNQGWTYAAIAEEVGVHWTTARRWGVEGLVPVNPKLTRDRLVLMLEQIPPSKRRAKAVV